jgi:hypothetical protein
MIESGTGLGIGKNSSGGKLQIIYRSVQAVVNWRSHSCVDKKKIVCQSCTYTELRNAALQRLMATNTNPNIRRQAIVGLMQKTR